MNDIVRALNESLSSTNPILVVLDGGYSIVGVVSSVPHDLSRAITMHLDGEKFLVRIAAIVAVKVPK